MTINLNHVANQVTTTGSNTNIPLVFQSKGTGAIDLAAGSSGVNISNGGTVTALTRTSAGSGYTSIPSVAVTSPTTAGGVQATATVAQMQIAGAAIQSGGTGYTVGDTLTIVGGTVVTSAATLTVTTVSAGVITGVSIAAFTNYTALPTNPVSVTGGTGSGATFNLTWAVISFTITNAGSGYVEQPTVSFSGGGGSGAAAYATVGSGTVVRSLGVTGTQSIDFYTPSSTSSGTPALRIRDTINDSYSMLQGGGGYTAIVAQGNAAASMNIASNGSGLLTLNTNGTNLTRQMAVAHTASAVNYMQATGQPTGFGPLFSAQGSDTNINMVYMSKGSGAHGFGTGGGAFTEQMRVTHTASAVNYVQVTGAATGAGNGPVISSQGSDTNVNLTFQSKGTGYLNVLNNRTNYFQFYGGNTGQAPTMYAWGSDTNIDLALTTKGTGAVKLNVGANTGKYTVLESDATYNMQLIGAANVANLGLYATGGGEIRFFTAANQIERQLNIARTASAVNYVQVTGAATGGYPSISAQGSDSSISFNVNSKGAGDVRLVTGGYGWVRLFPNGTEVVRATGVASGVNYVNFTGAAAGSAPSMASAGTDTNIDLALTPKGTGYVQFGAYTGTALSIAGYIEIKDAGGTVRKLAVVA